MRPKYVICWFFLMLQTLSTSYLTQDLLTMYLSLTLRYDRWHRTDHVIAARAGNLSLPVSISQPLTWSHGNARTHIYHVLTSTISDLGCPLRPHATSGAMCPTREKKLYMACRRRSSYVVRTSSERVRDARYHSH